MQAVNPIKAVATKYAHKSSRYLGGGISSFKFLISSFFSSIEIDGSELELEGFVFYTESMEVLSEMLFSSMYSLS